VAVLRGTVEQQRLEQARLWEPIRQLLQTTLASVRQLLTDARQSADDATLRSASRSADWWNEHAAGQLANAKLLMPSARSELDALKTDLQALAAEFLTLGQLGRAPNQVELSKPKLIATAGSLELRLVKLIDIADRVAPHYGEPDA
jgi:hypothetical protein